MALTQEQIEFRRTGVTASEIAAVCGLNPWSSPGEVWADKLGMTEQWDGNEDTERGNELEDALVRWTGRRIGKKVQPNKMTWRSATEEIALATPDGLVYATDPMGHEEMSGTIEVKAPSWRTYDHWSDPVSVPDGVPKYYLVQAQYQAGVLGLPEAIVSGLIDGRLWVYRLPFSEGLFKALVSRAKEFWTRYVVKKEAPPFVPGESAEWVAEVYREQVYKDLVDPPKEKIEDLRHAATTYALAREAQKKASYDMSSAKGYLTSVIGEHEGLRLPGWKCTWKQGSDRIDTDWETIAKKALDKLAGIVDLETMDQWITEATAKKPGTRTFNLKQEK